MKKIFIALCGGLLMAVLPAQAQFELKAGSFNNTFVPQDASGAAATASGPAIVANPPPTSGQSAAVLSLMGSAGPRTVDNLPGNPLYPSNVTGTMRLAKASIGSGFAAGVPRYALGDEITPPTSNYDGTLAVGSNYWRAQPIFPGEIIPGIAQAPVPQGTVSVTSASINATTVTVASVPPELVPGATLLGEPITRVLGNTVTLAGNAATTVTGATPFPIIPASSFYYSPHAGKVFAHQPGRVQIRWVTRVPDGGELRIKEEIFSVSSNTSRPIRTIFWTEGTFDGPKVKITDGRITTVSPAHNLQVPKAVAEEIPIPGYNPVTPNLTTLSFEKFNGAGELHAYNVEGRVLIEYLGNVRGTDGSYEFVGSEILELKRTAPVGYPMVSLGKEIVPGNGRTDQIPVPVLSNQQNGASYYGTTVRPDQTLSYFAERETSPANDPDNGGPRFPNEAYNKVVFYWLERSDFNINWPTHQDRYWLRWSPNLTDYAHYTVDPTGSTPATGISFTGGVLPQLVYQDDSAQVEAKLDSATQSFHAKPGGDERNRALLKFSSNGETWYVNVYTQTETRALTVAATTPSVAPDTGTIVTTGNTTGLAPGLRASIFNQGGLETTIARVLDGNRYSLNVRVNVPYLQVDVYNASGGFLGYYDGSANNPPLPSTSVVTVPSTVGLETGMIVSGAGITGTASILRIIDATHYELSAYVQGAATNFTHTVQSDSNAPINTAATVGTRIPPPAGHQLAGYISGGKGYYPEAYLNPFVSGVPAANLGAVIPVNAQPGNNVLTVRWFKKITAPGTAFKDLFVPGKTGRYTVSFPTATTPEIIIAQGVGTDDLPPAESSGTVYYQNDDTKPGFNPNEEHAFTLGGRAYALRDDLNITNTSEHYTSEPCVLLAYTDPADSRPAMHAYKVKRSNATFDFDYISTAGTLLVKPYPLPLMPPPLVPTGVGSAVRSKDIEIVGTNLPDNGTLTGEIPYSGFTFQDRKGFTWIHRGPHNPPPVEPTGGKSFSGGDAGEGLDLDGTFVYAFNVGTPGTSGQARDATFTEDNAAGITVNAPNEVGTWHNPDYGSTPSDNVLEHVMTSIRWAGAPATLGVNLANIIRGGRYKLQLLFAETVTQRGFDIVVEGRTVADDFLPGLYQGSTNTRGTVFSYEFNGGDDTLNIVLNGNTTLAADKNPTLSGVTLERLPDTPNLTMKLYYPSREGFYVPEMATQPAVGTIMPFLRQPGRSGQRLNLTLTNEDQPDEPLPIIYRPAWPQQAPELRVGETLALPKFGLPQVRGQISAQVLYQQSLAQASTASALTKNSVTLHDATREKTIALDAPTIGLTAIPGSIATTSYRGKTYFQRLAPHLQQRIFVDPIRGAKGTLIFTGAFHDEIAGEDYFDLNLLSAEDETALKSLAAVSDPNKSKWDAAIDALNTRVETFKENPAVAGTYIPDPTKNQDVGENDLAKINSPDTAVDSYAVTATGQGLGYVTMVFGNGRAFTPEGDPVQVKVFKVAPELYTGDLKVVASSNPLDEQVALRHSGDFAGKPGDYEFEWRWWGGADNSTEPATYTGAAPGTDVVTTNTDWQTPGGQNQATGLLPYGPSMIVGGSPSNPFGGSLFVLNDRWFTVRYRPKASAANVLGTQWSRWLPPQFVEGWVKRVLAGINPFEQRVKDLFNNGINTDISVLTQAGKRWEGDIALTLSNINDVGLIEIYETVLNRAKAMSIDANTNDPDTNNALLLAAGYLNDLYTLLGNEAYADAANPTISIDDEGSAATVNTSRFSFEGQIASSLDEELALLRGRNDFVSPGVKTAPAYNRLYWNYTRGINSGEAIYALNYNIKEKVGSTTANGVIDESDAQRMFPQGHGDAYGHYLTALSGYYKLLTHEKFTWTPRAEAVTVLGQAVTVDYFDERKFAAAAGNLARTAQQVLALTWRQNYKDDPAAGWDHFRDKSAINPRTNVKSAQGFDEWVSRSAQGTFYHWAVANSMLPVEDLVHTGIQKIDRTTVPEISELATIISSFQTTMDSANAHLNPLGLSPGAIAFDIAPAKILIDILEGGGASHYQQIAERALTALNNAAGAFNQAAVMTGALRNQENSLDDFNTGIVEQERAFRNELIDLYGRPYSGEIGAGKLYAQGYEGPDLFHWYIVDRPNDLVNTSLPVTIDIKEATGFAAFTGNTIADLVTGLNSPTNTTALVNRRVTINPNQFAQYNDVWQPGGLGSRAESGELQDALLDAQQTLLALSEFNTSYARENANLRQSILVFNDFVALHQRHLSETGTTNTKILALEGVKLALETVAHGTELAAESAGNLGAALAEVFPRSVGLATDATAPARGAVKLTAETVAVILRTIAVISQAGAGATGIAILSEEQKLDTLLTEIGFSFEQKQAAAEFAVAYREFVSHSHELMQLTLDHQRAQQNVNNVIARGNRILADREVFRQRAAAIIQGYRTRDVSFRLFRNESLEQYRSLFDLASRYSYLAAKSYDYETGLLGTPAGQGLFQKIVSSRALGDLTDGTPQLTTSTIGDSGLAGSMARLNADYSVANGRLGINNPDQNGTVFSLRTELYRIMQNNETSSDEEAWRQTLEQHMKANVLNDADVASLCGNLRKPNGTPVPGIVIPFSTAILHGKNFFGLELAGGDHNFTPSNFATRIFNVGIALPGYVGMDPYAPGDPSAGAPASGAIHALSATPYVYLIPCGLDYMLAPPLGDTNTLRTWKVEDQALPLPFNLGANDFNAIQFFNANGTLSEKPWITRKHQAFRAVDDHTLFEGAPEDFTNSRLIGRSVWNSQWKIVIPAYSLLSDEQEGLNRFAASVQDIQLFLKTYSNAGN